MSSKNAAAPAAVTSGGEGGGTSGGIGSGIGSGIGGGIGGGIIVDGVVDGDSGLDSRLANAPSMPGEEGSRVRGCSKCISEWRADQHDRLTRTQPRHPNESAPFSCCPSAGEPSHLYKYVLE